MSAVSIPNKDKNGIRCHRCNGPMAMEKFYGKNDSFYGWHCLICGAILDPVILLHHLSQDANLVIPEDEKEILLLMKKYIDMNRRKKNINLQNEIFAKSSGDLSTRH